MIKAVSLDVYNTLIDLSKYYTLISEEIARITNSDPRVVGEKIVRAHKEALKHRLFGGFKRVIIESADMYAKSLGVRREDIYRAIIRTLDRDEIKDLIFPDVKEALRMLKEKNVLIATIGNVLSWPGMVTRYLLDKNGVLEYFVLTVFMDEVGYMKPQKEIFLFTAEQLGISIDELLHVGDSPENDLAGALLAGAKAALINRGLNVPIARIGRSAFIINDLRKLVDVIDELNKDEEIGKKVFT
ncbi:MAG: HAD family hydrolase [Staphylothermus sp.]|nr:HAD family hydrolase [Staphylothermus sp.]